jgi:hypothetical protein
MVLNQKKKMKVLAYEIEHNTHWEPGVPHRDHPDYWELLHEAYRSQIRQDGFHYDLVVDESVFPNFNELLYEIWNNPASDYQVEVDIPNPIVFGAWFEFMEYLDYPYVFRAWPIMSPQMLETIKSVGDFQHCTYPTLMEDMNALQGSNSRTGMRKNDFLVVRTLEFLDAYDWEKSEYVREKSMHADDDDDDIFNYKTNFTKVVLKEPIPSLFRLVGHATALYVSAAAKEALEISGTARGVNFTPIDEEYEMTLWGYKKNV